ncbi:MAG TPA: NAD(P)-binding domain-containing protein [Acidimicrobiales bacterium]|nr:NAD(P)-binding domain-containing protein [Acidimicrobiales bacterium]
MSKQLPHLTMAGLGAMGRACATTWLDAGYPVTVWNRTPGRADALVDRGATAAGTLAEAVEASDVVVVCILDNAGVQDVLGPVADRLAGRTVVNLTTGTPGEARELAGWAAEHGADYLDGVIMAVPAQVGRPEAMILYGGSEAAYDRHRATLATLAGNSPHLGADAGLPALYDAGLLSLLYATMTGWLQAFAVVGAGDVSAADFLPYAQAWFENVVTGEDGAEVAFDVDRGTYPDRIPSSLGLNAGALQMLVRVQEEVGVDAGILAAISTLADRRVADGHGDDGYTSLIESIRQPLPV